MEPFNATTQAWEVWKKFGQSESVMLTILAQLIADNYDMKNKLQEEGK